MTTVFESDWENSRLLEENERLRAQNTKMYDEIERLRILSKQMEEALEMYAHLERSNQWKPLATNALAAYKEMME